MMFHFLKMMRPQQWLKNFILYFPPILGGAMLNPELMARGILPFTAFCLASSAGYVFNDIIDSDNDRFHPRKKERPLAAGKLGKKQAFLFGGLLLALALITGAFLGLHFLLFLTAYMVLTASYSLTLKNMPIIDLFCISAGFLVRLEAGGYVFSIAVSEWLFLSVFLLSLFLAAGKRYSEKLNIPEAESHRQSLLAYPEGFLKGTLCLTGSAVLVTYAIYVVSRPALLYTVPLCCLGLLRYLFIVLSGKEGDPTSSIIRDVPLLLISLIWAVMVFSSLYSLSR